jgi:FtsZ-binding cell division protein ZapB
MMEGKETLAIKRTLYNIGTQHNKLTTMVMVCLKEIEKLKKEMNELREHNNLPTSQPSSDNDNESHINSNSKQLENEAQNILKQLNLNN